MDFGNFNSFRSVTEVSQGLARGIQCEKSWEASLMLTVLLRNLSASSVVVDLSLISLLRIQYSWTIVLSKLINYFSGFCQFIVTASHFTIFLNFSINSSLFVSRSRMASPLVGTWLAVFGYQETIPLSMVFCDSEYLEILYRKFSFLQVSSRIPCCFKFLATLSKN